MEISWWEATCTLLGEVLALLPEVPETRQFPDLGWLMRILVDACRCVCTCGVDMAWGLIWSGPLIKAVFSWPSSYPCTVVGTQLQTLIPLSGLVWICAAATPQVLSPTFPETKTSKWGTQHQLYSAECWSGDIICVKIITMVWALSFHSGLENSWPRRS